MRELRHRFGGLPRPAEAEDIWKEIWVHEAHNSTAIEGNALVFREVERLLAENRAVGSKALKDYLEVKGYADAARWVYDQGTGLRTYPGGNLLTLTEVRHVHRLAMTQVWQVAPHPDAHEDEAPGNWRPHDIHAFPGGMKPPAYPEVPALMRDWVLDVCGAKDGSGPIGETIGKLHVEFERIHPFLDGNGRAGRLLANLVLVRLGYPPALIQNRERQGYLRALRQADRGSYGPIGEVFARAILDNVMRFVIPAVAGPARLVPIEALATRDVSAGALRVAAYRGRLRAQRGTDRVWRSTRGWVDEYLADRYGRLRQPRSRRSTRREAA